MNKVQFFYLIVLGLSLAWSLFCAIKTIVKKLRKGEEVCVDDLTGVVMDNMIRVEELYNNFQNFGTNFSNNKLEDVLTKVQNFCLCNDISYDQEFVTDMIEKFINFSKKVNSK